MAYTTIKKPSDYFNTKLYTGNGSSGHAITGVEHQPDLTWIKQRSGAEWHTLIDSVRGVTKYINSNDAAAERTSSNFIESFDSNGFTLGSANDINQNSATYASWNWLANGAGVANTDGSISSTVSANTTSGFSIVSWTGTGSASTIGHGLSSAPKMVIVKSRSAAGEWTTWHTGINIQAKLSLNTTDAIYNPGSGLYWNSTLPTSSVFSVGTSGGVNGSGKTYVAYCFAEKQGFSKFGSYTGNGSTDGTFIYTGFKPAFVIFKNTTTANRQWYLMDNKRNTYNVANIVLAPNQANDESWWGTGNNADFLSNGIKIKSNSDINNSGDNYIYMAFAEQPLVGDNPATAR